MEEIWKEIKNSKFYEVSNLGRIKRLEHDKWNEKNKAYSTYKEKILTLSNNNSKKYWRIKIYYNDNTMVTESVHRLVAKAFIPNPENKEQINHINLNKDDNTVSNLEWVTNLENMQHSNLHNVRKDLYKSMEGEDSHLNKYTEETIRKIPELIKLGNNYAKTAKILGIPSTLINEIKAKRAWKHLNMEIPDSPDTRGKKKI
jgi:hypothetical protein